MKTKHDTGKEKDKNVAGRGKSFCSSPLSLKLKKTEKTNIISAYCGRVKAVV
jgi:hypothetical protein